MGEVKAINKYISIDPYFTFEVFARRIIEAAGNEYPVYLLDKFTGTVKRLNELTVKSLAKIFSEIKKDAAITAKYKLPDYTDYNRYLCYYITKEELESAPQAQKAN